MTRGAFMRVAGLVVLGAAMSYLATLAADTSAGILTACAVAALLPLAARPEHQPPSGASVGPAIALAVVTLLLSFDGGGYVASAPPLGVAILALALGMTAVLSDVDHRGLSRYVVVAAAALVGLTLWAGLSQVWSDAPALAWLGTGRPLLYGLALIAFAQVAQTARQREALLRAVATALVIVLGAGLLARLAPDVLHTPVIRGGKRISYPLGYWNGMAFVGAAALAFCFHLTTRRSEPAVVRIFASAAIPTIVATEFLTFSRGGLVSCAIVLVVYVALTAERSMVPGAMTALLGGGSALWLVARSDALSAQAKLSGSGLSEGHRIAWLLLVFTMAVALVRAAVCVAERREELARDRPRPAWAGAVAVLLLVALVGVGVADGSVRRQLTHSFEQARGDSSVKERSDLGFISSRGRVDEWKVVLKGFEQSRLHGSGVDTFGDLWTVHRPAGSEAGTEAHSLYIETLGELGLVGLALVVVTLAALLVGIARRAIGRDGAVAAVVLAVFLAWLVQAGVEWMWELTAASVWLFSLLGACLAVPPRSARAPGDVRPLVAAVVLAVIATGAGRIAIADAFSERSVQSFAKGSCAAATKQARKAADLADLRPESSRVLGLCSARAHDYAAAAKQLDRAVELDPGHWRSWYDLALVRAAGRLPGPGRAAYAASLRNPSEPFLRFAARDLRSPSRQTVRDARRQISEARNDLPGS